MFNLTPGRPPKLSPTDLASVLERRTMGEKIIDLAVEYEVDPKAIYSLIRRAKIMGFSAWGTNLRRYHNSRDVGEVYD